MDLYLHHASDPVSGLEKQIRRRTAPSAQAWRTLAQMACILVQEAFKLLERQAVDLALEVDHRIHRHPVFVPAPGVEFRVAAGAQRNIAITPGQAQQKPD